MKSAKPLPTMSEVSLVIVELICFSLFACLLLVLPLSYIFLPSISVISSANHDKRPWF